MELRDLGSTGIRVSPLGLGTVKLGRNRQVKYPRPFEIPDDRAARTLLELARSLGINLLDTAPAYGTAQQRVGTLLPGSRGDWVIVSKVGEFFDADGSRFDFRPGTAIATVEQSLRALRTDYLDAVLIHSDGNDLAILNESGVVDALDDLKARGLIRATGISSKTVDGGLAAVERLDVVMATYNLAERDERPVLDAAARAGKAVLVKKGLMSGHVDVADGAERAIRFVLDHPAVSSMIVGTIDPQHLAENVAAVEAALD